MFDFIREEGNRMYPEIGLSAAVSAGRLLLTGTVNPFEIDPLAFQHHPVRVAVGVLCLVLALLLTIYQKTWRKARDARRKRKFGETVSHTTASAPTHKTKQKGERRYGELLWTLFFPSYKGGSSKAGAADLSRRSPNRHRQASSEDRYGSFRFPNPFNLYRGGGSKAGSAKLGQSNPDSYKERWGSEKRYGSFRFPNPFNLYRGGESKAKSARFGRSQPESYKESWGSESRYGSFQFPNPFNLYRGGGSKAGEGRSHAQHQPSSHTGRLFSLRGGWEADADLSSYKGGESRAEGAKLGFALPLSYRSRPGQQKKTYRFRADVSSYSGGGAAGEGRIPLPHVPTSHGGHRLRRSQLAGWKPFAAIESYRGGIATAGEAIIQNLAPGVSHKRRIIPAVRYGFSPKELPAPSYKGGWAIAKPARLGRRAPQSHRFRLPWNQLGSKRWSVPVNSYKGGYGVAGVGKPIQELPLSYKEPWGFKARYFGFRGYRLLPIRMDGSPWPEFRHVGPELPPSYKEPWGFKIRYLGRKNFHLLPIHMDGAPHPDFRPVVELPASYKEPWGSKRRFGRGFGWKWTIPGAGYRGGSKTNPVRPWQNPDTGEVFVEHMSDKKRYGTSKYGGKLYGQRSQHYYIYHREEVPDYDVEWRLVRVGGVPVDEYGNKILTEEKSAEPVETPVSVEESAVEAVEVPASVEERAAETVETPVSVEETVSETSEESAAVQVTDESLAAPPKNKGKRRRKRRKKSS